MCNILVKHQGLADIIGSMLLHREDLSYSVALHNMAATFYYYCERNEMLTFNFLAHAAVSELFLGFFSKDAKTIH